MENFLGYWKEVHGTRSIASYYGSDRFPSDMSPGDRLWIVNLTESELYLLAPLLIDRFEKDADVVAVAIDRSNIIQKREYVIAKKPYENVARIRITDAARQFITYHADGRIEEQQFRSIRKIPEEFAELLEKAWRSHAAQIPPP